MKNLLAILASIIAYGALSTLFSCVPVKEGYLVTRYTERGRIYYQVLKDSTGLEYLTRGELKRALADWDNFQYKSK